MKQQTQFSELGGVQQLGVLWHLTSVRKQHVSTSYYKPQFSLESLLPGHQASQTKFLNSRILGWSNGPRYKKEWLQRRWPGLSLQDLIPMDVSAWGVSVCVCVCVCVSRSVQTGLGTPKPGVSSLGSESSLVRMPSVWSMSALALCNLLLDAQLEGLSQGWVQRRVC